MKKIILNQFTIIIDRRNDVPEKGYYMGPVVLKTNINTEVYKNELFGPVLSIINTSSLESAIDIINMNQYGNGTCLFSDSLQEVSMFQDLWKLVKLELIYLFCPTSLLFLVI